MKRLNLKFLVLFLIPTIALAVGLHFLHGSQSKQAQKRWYDHANKAKEEGRLREAYKQLTKYINKNQDDMEAWKLGATLATDIYLDRNTSDEGGPQPGDLKTAKNTIHNAFVAAAKDREARSQLKRQLVEILMHAGDWSEAYEHILNLLDESPDDIELNQFAAKCANLQKRDLECETFLAKIVGFQPNAEEGPRFDEAAALDSHDVESYWSLAQFYQEERANPELAQLVIKHMFATNKDLAGSEENINQAALAWLYRGIFTSKYQASGTRDQIKERRGDSREDVVKSLMLNPDSEKALLALSSMDQQEGNYKTAKESLEKALEKHPKSVNIYRRLARLGQVMGDLDAADKAIDAGLKLEPGNTELLWRRCQHQLIDGDGPGLAKTIETMRKQLGVDQTTIRVAQAMLPMCNEEWKKASKRLIAVRSEVADKPSLRESVDFSLARCYGETNEIDLQLDVYREMSRDPLYGSRDEVILGLAGAMAKLGLYQEAYNTLLPRVRSGREYILPDLIVLAEHVSQFIETTNDLSTIQEIDISSEAEEVVSGTPEEWVKEEGFWLKIGSKTARLLATQDEAKQQEALDYYGEALELYHLEMDQMPEQRKDVALTVWKTNYYAYINSVLGLRGQKAALEALQAMREARGDSKKNFIVTSRLIARGPESPKKRREMLKAIESRIETLPEKEQSEAWIQLGSAYAVTGQLGIADSKRCWANASSLAVSDTAALQQLFLLARQSGDEQGMQDALQRIKDSAGEDDPLWKYAQAHYLLGKRKPDGSAYSESEMQVRYRKALELVTDAMKGRPNWVLPYHLRAKVREELGDLDGTVSDYMEAWSRGARDTTMLGNLISLLISRKDFRAAQRVLATAPDSLPERMRFEAVLASTSGNNVRDIIETIDSYTPNDSSDWYSHVEKGEMYRRAAARFYDRELIELLHERSLEAYQGAIKVGPDVADTWMVLIDFLIGTVKDVSEAEDALRSAENWLPDDQTRLMMAEMYLRLGEDDLAEQYLLSELNVHPGNLAALRGLASYYLRTDQQSLGIDRLEQMIAHDYEDAERELNQVMWARRTLAITLFNTRLLDDFHEALGHIEWNLQAKPDNLEDELLKARFYAMRDEPRYRRQAMETLQRLYDSRRDELNFDSILLLAGLRYRDAQGSSESNWSLSRDAMDLLRDEERARQNERTPEQQSQLLAQYATMLIDRNEFDQARNLIRDLGRLRPNDIRTIRLIARWNVVNKNAENADKIIGRLIPTDEVNEENIDRLILAARLLDENGINHRAEEVFRRAAREHPKGKVQLGRYLARSGETGEAIFIADELAKSGNFRDACRIGLEAVQKPGAISDTVAKKRRNQVGQWFTMARQNGGEKNFQLRMMEADFFIEVSDEEEAIQSYREMLDQWDLTTFEQGQVANNLAYLLAARGEQLDEALRLVNLALEYLGPAAGALDTKGVVQLARKECEGALQSIQESVSMDANQQIFAGYLQGGEEANAQAYFHLALAYQCVGDKKGARQAMDTALERGFRTDNIRPLKREWYDRLADWLR